jgi:hypothetical protein
MRIFARWAEVKQDISLSGVPQYQLKKLLETKQFSARLVECRELPKNSPARKEKAQYGFHRIVLTQNIAADRLTIKLSSSRLYAKDIIEFGYTPIAKAVEKETRNALLAKLNKSP